MGGADVEVLFGAGSPVAAAFASALTRSHGERLAAVAAGEVDTATLSLLRDTASVCPGCKASTACGAVDERKAARIRPTHHHAHPLVQVILVKEAGCATVVCAMCDARFVAATHKFGAPAAAAATGKQ